MILETSPWLQWDGCVIREQKPDKEGQRPHIFIMEPTSHDQIFDCQRNESIRADFFPDQRKKSGGGKGIAVLTNRMFIEKWRGVEDVDLELFLRQAQSVYFLYILDLIYSDFDA